MIAVFRFDDGIVYSQEQICQAQIQLESSTLPGIFTLLSACKYRIEQQTQM
jgi:hypothetical protein